MPAQSVLWSNSSVVKYRVRRCERGYQVERLRKKRVPQEDERSDYVWYKYEFLPERTFYVSDPELVCDPRLCAQAYFLGACEHARVIARLLVHWQALREEYLLRVCRTLAQLARRLRELREQLLLWQASLAHLPHSRLILGSYILFTPHFLTQFSLRQLLVIIRAVRFPLESCQGLDHSEIIDQVCRFNDIVWESV